MALSKNLATVQTHEEQELACKWMKLDYASNFHKFKPHSTKLHMAKTVT
jgi:hypothetical protein